MWEHAYTVKARRVTGQTDMPPPHTGGAHIPESQLPL